MKKIFISKSVFFAVGIHFFISLFLCGFIALLIFGLWYPFPYRDLAGGRDIFFIIFLVDIVCGPVLMLVIFNPAKPRAELVRDIALIATMQLLALGYGVYTLSYARPVAMVYEIDRFRVVSFADLYENEAEQIPNWAQPWGFSSPRTMGIRLPKTGEEQLSSIELSFAGIEPSQRPSQWQDYALNVPQVLQRARPLSDLRAKHPEQMVLIDAAVSDALSNWEQGETTDAQTLRWLPLVSRSATDWVVLLDPITARARGYVHLDGF